MSLDIATLFAVTVVTVGLGGVLLLFAWMQARSTLALAWWGAAFFLFAPATALFAARGLIADVWSIQVANAVMMLSYGLLWTGARVFEGRRPLPFWIVAGSLLWMVACQFDAFMQSVPSRIVLASAVISAYTLGFVYELWRERHDGLVSRWPLMTIAILHVVLFPVRVPYLMKVPFPLETPSFGQQSTSLLLFAPLIYAFALVFLLMALTKERAESNQRHAATIDPLTSIPNRRGFGERADRLIARARRDQAPLALLLFDLDRFKDVNDRFGHLTGDAVLVAFTRTATASLRPLDLIGRIGGEEFVALLPSISTETAMEIAERVRSTFETEAGEISGHPVAATVSIGLAHTTQAGYDFDALYTIADTALYQAKQKGRNRVETGRPIREVLDQRLGMIAPGTAPT